MGLNLIGSSDSWIQKPKNQSRVGTKVGTNFSIVDPRTLLANALAPQHSQTFQLLAKLARWK